MKKVKCVGFLGDFYRDGYRDGYLRLECVYISRKTVINDDTEVYESRDGRLFYYRPNWTSTRYSYRCYLV